MAYVVCAKWRAKEGKADRLLEVIEEMTPPASGRGRAFRANPWLRASSPITRSIGLPSWVPLVSAIERRRCAGSAAVG